MFYLMKPISVLSAEMVMQLSADLTNAKLIFLRKKCSNWNIILTL